MTKGIIYYTDNQLAPGIAGLVQTQLLRTNLPIVSTSLQPISFGQNIHVPLERGYLAMFKQILVALEASTADVVFFCEHDVLYPLDHFDFTATEPGVFYYNTNVWKLRLDDNFAVQVDNMRQVSGICVHRETALQHYRERVAMVEAHGYHRDIGFEPGTHQRIVWTHPLRSETWRSIEPLVDIRHTSNLTPNRWSTNEFRSKKWCENWTEGPCPTWAVSLIYPQGAPVFRPRSRAASTLERVGDYFHVERLTDRRIEIANAGREDLAGLFRFLGYTRGAEIGVESGAYARVLLDANPNLRLACVDSWSPYRQYLDHLSAEKLNGFYETARAVLRPYPGARLIRRASVDAAREFEDHSLDFVYIDANHVLPYVIEDLHTWSPKVRPGGIIAGHDYVRRKATRKSSAPCHVVEAVHAWTESYHITPLFILGAKGVTSADEVRDDVRSWFWVKME